MLHRALGCEAVQVAIVGRSLQHSLALAKRCMSMAPYLRVTGRLRLEDQATGRVFHFTSDGRKLLSGLQPPATVFVDHAVNESDSLPG